MTVQRLKACANCPHELIGKLHRQFIEDITKELFYTTNLTGKEIRKAAYEKFKEKYPDVYCTFNHFATFSSNQDIALRYPLKNEEIRDEIMPLISEYYPALDSLHQVEDKIYSIVNSDRKNASIRYIRSLVREYDKQQRFLIVPDSDFDKEWLPEYDELLLSYYYDQQYCVKNNPEMYLDKFLTKCGKSFSRRLIKIRLLNILPPAEQPKPLEDLESIPNEVITSIKSNVVAFLKRRLNYSEIARKIQFLFQTEGIDATIDDVNNLLNKLNFTTENHEKNNLPPSRIT
jgi:hypothetical protein